MTFIAGLIVGIVSGLMSWVAAAAWLEVTRLRRERLEAGIEDITPAAALRNLHQQPSRI